jgi:putative GTP pyrophosphokinase
MKRLESTYRQRFETVLQPLALAIKRQLREYFRSEARIDRIAARAKSVERFLTKAETVVDGKRKYTEPLREIQDQAGARIVTFYTSDVERIDAIVRKYYRPIESRGSIPDSEWKF